MKIAFHAFFKKILILLILSVGFVHGINAQSSITMSTANCTITANEVQMDILVTNTGSIDLRWNSAVLRMNVPAAMIPAGTQTYTIYYLGGSDFPLSWPAVYPATPFGGNYNAATRVLTWTTGNTSAYNNNTCSAPLVSPGQTKTIGRFSFKITSSTFVVGAVANFAWHTTSAGIFYQNCTTFVTGYNQASGLTTLINPCTLTVPAGPCGSVVASALTTAVTSCGGSDGTANISLINVASNEQGTYTVNGGSPQSFVSNPFTITGLSSGSYAIVISGSFIPVTCTSVATTFIIAEPVPITATFTTTNISTCNTVNLNTGSIAVTSSNGIAPYIYSWTGPNGYTAGNTPTINGLSAGNYIVTITAANSCVGNISIPINSANAITVTTVGSVLNTCGNTGSIQLHPGGGAPGYTYSLDNITYQASSVFTGLAAGNYTGWTKDSKSCTASVGVTIGTNPGTTIAQSL